MSFSGDMRNFGDRTMNNLEEVKRASAFDLFGAIILGTPVDKGVLRNNWFAQLGHPSNNQNQNPDPSGKEALTRLKTNLTHVDAFTDIYFTNNLPYGVFIEYDGTSAKAPNGMVRVNVARWEAIVNRNARKFL